MEKLPRRVYTAEFRQQAVEMIIRDGLGIAEASRRLSISPKTLANWVSRAKDGNSLEAVAAPRRAATEEEAELGNNIPDSPAGHLEWEGTARPLKMKDLYYIRVSRAFGAASAVPTQQILHLYRSASHKN